MTAPWPSSPAFNAVVAVLVAYAVLVAVVALACWLGGIVERALERREIR